MFPNQIPSKKTGSTIGTIRENLDESGACTTSAIDPEMTSFMPRTESDPVWPPADGRISPRIVTTPGEDSCGNPFKAIGRKSDRFAAPHVCQSLHNNTFFLLSLRCGSSAKVGQPDQPSVHLGLVHGQHSKKMPS
jgi:hypothetical protein